MPLQAPERQRIYLFPRLETTRTADEICGLSDHGSGALLHFSPRLLRFPLEQKNLTALPHISKTVAFQHLWPVSPNEVVGYPDWLEIQTFAHTVPILIRFWREVERSLMSSLRNIVDVQVE
ncbi:hypothetical protein AVEN_132075-1 [Araneus ventricosus]|uniref:Uncharacterized protein n=1 Tax=Araneus ventricosus TaxID=182803 RepID=A0A4Y2FDK2_ARAVE|nr:hypothetical protein AVEN_132075-1 [Araneus ventricosus]